MLVLDLSKIRTAEERFDRTYQPEQLGRDDAFSIRKPVTLGFDIFKDKKEKDQFRLTGRIQTTLELLCSRCLEPLTVPVDAEFDLRYQPHAQNTGEGEREIEEDDLATAFYEHDEIDLGQLMKEQFYLALPMKPLCRDECKGLCPTCGANWNRDTCACPNAWDDPRLAALRTLTTDQRNHDA